MNDFVRIMNENGDCSTLFVNQIQTGFAFASKIDYLCRRESDNALSLFLFLVAKRNAICVKSHGKRMCQNEPNPESQIKDFRGFSSFRELGNAANGIFYSSQCWESRFSPISCFPNVGKVDFR